MHTKSVLGTNNFELSHKTSGMLHLFAQSFSRVKSILITYPDVLLRVCPVCGNQVQKLRAKLRNSWNSGEDLSLGSLLTLFRS